MRVCGVAGCVIGVLISLLVFFFKSQEREVQAVSEQSVKVPRGKNEFLSRPPALRMGACCSARGTGGTPGEARTGNLDLGEAESCEPEVPTKPAAIIATPPATPPAGNTESVAECVARRCA